METAPPAARLHAWLRALPPAQLNALSRRYAHAAAEGGATIRKPDGQVQPIPPLLTPEVLDEAQVAQMEENAHALVEGLSRLTAWLMTSERGATLKRRLFPAFGALEAEALDKTWREAERLVTARVDYLVDEGGTPRALEVNATIPAMQGYSDIVADAFVREVARERGASPLLAAALLDANGRNADHLLDSLRAHDALLGGPESGPRRIAIVARAGDSQLGELGYLAARWTALGCETRIATPEDARLDDKGNLLVAGVHPDLIYRHVFARRLDPASDFARALLDPRRHRILNPIASHLEIKAMLGLLSQAADEERFAEEIGLEDFHVTEVRRSVPWTRLLAPGPTRGPSGEPIADLAATVAAEPDRFVIKRSWDYGGRGVFLGMDHDEAAARRAADVLGETVPIAWRDLVAAGARDEKDAWVAQALVPAHPRHHLVAGDTAEWRDLYVDLSVYTNLGVSVRPRGGVSRAALRRIVNLQGGGGLAPLIRAEVLDRLLGGV